MRRLEDAQPLYILPQDNLAEGALIPAFAEALAAECMVGFFSSASLAEIAPGLATYLQTSTSPLRLIVSPFISVEDQRAIQQGINDAKSLGALALERLLIATDELEQHTLKCLSYLLSVGRLQMKVAIMRDGSLFHPKVWLFETREGQIAIHGSGNATKAGIKRNKEQVSVSRKWQDPTQRFTVERLRDEFERLWQDHDDSCSVINLPKALEQQLLAALPKNRAPTEDDCLALLAKLKTQDTGGEPPSGDIEVPGRPRFAIPSWLKYQDGDYAHQGRAVNAWVDAGNRGTLEMATGSGKTLTSMIAAHRLFEAHHPLFIVIAAPYVPLIQQWCDEAAVFGIKPANLTEVSGAQSRAKLIAAAWRRLRLGTSDVEVVVVSHDTLCSAEFQAAVAQVGCDSLLIADEAHNLGRVSFTQQPPDHFKHRLALSATPVRQYDPDGTAAVFAFFGPPVFSFTLKEAIGTCLVPYDYWVHPVHLTPVEMTEWEDLTAQIRQNAWRQAAGKSDDFLSKLLRDRRALLETASAKIRELARLLDLEDLPSLRHTLIYTSDKAPEQLETINRLLHEKGVLFHQLTDKETADRGKTRSILESFKRGEIQVLTAKRVLDEGVNIPQVVRAYVLASTTVERQWVQRRGRVLRMCPEIGKIHSAIHDLIALPPTLDKLDADAKSLVKSELRRAQEFASLARNAGLPGGPLETLHPLVRTTMM